MECALLRYPYADLGPGNIAAFKADWIDLLRAIKTERFLIAVQKACQSTSFFPLMADIVKHIPPAQPLPQCSGPTEEDLRRKKAGERSYGLPEVRVLSKLHQTKHAKEKRALIEEEIEGLIVDLDKMIDIHEAATR